MNGVDYPVGKVLDGIAAAREAGFGPIKVNMVVRRGLNEDSVVPMARWARTEGHILRFIEYMDVGHSNGWRLDEVVPAREVVAAISAEMPLEAVPPNYPGEVADRWRYVDGTGELGVIASVTQPFCGVVHPGPDLGRGSALHLPVRPQGHRPPGTPARRGDGRAAGRGDPGGLVGPDRPLLGAALGGDRRPAPGRDVRDGWLIDRVIHRSSTGGWIAWTGRRAIRPSSWISALTAFDGRPVP